ncbi:Uncharacterized protein APZ42_030067 [Daphnia magna]|uniref:Reverse transcriptase/retrotransposon-derived protein RNase H-like domain-containing protein n=1 Tax=Daphnia magna TaxID=35525 RepID=A0A164P3I6_9CRUS|nr:Uncharacterized protein APZ42_030067 [Daphnia magna]
MSMIGAVLSQIQDGQEHPIAYSSRQLTKAEMKYSTTEKEALAVINQENELCLAIRNYLEKGELGFHIIPPPSCAKIIT